MNQQNSDSYQYRNQVSQNHRQIDQDYENQDLNSKKGKDKQQVKFVVPSSKNKLKACMRCRLLKTQQQWINDDRCQNCPNLTGKMSNNTTTKYQNVVSIIDPSKSWLRKKLKLSSKIVPGAYAVQLLEDY